MGGEFMEDLRQEPGDDPEQHYSYFRSLIDPFYGIEDLSPSFNERFPLADPESTG